MLLKIVFTFFVLKILQSINYFGNMAKDRVLKSLLFISLTFTQKLYSLSFQKMPILMFLKWSHLKKILILTLSCGNSWN
jgi:hypothetical protein